MFVAHNGVRKQNTLRQHWLYRIHLVKKPLPPITAIFNEKAIRPCFREKDFLDENHAWKD